MTPEREREIREALDETREQDRAPADHAIGELLAALDAERARARDFVRAGIEHATGGICSADDEEADRLIAKALAPAKVRRW